MLSYKYHIYIDIISIAFDMVYLIARQFVKTSKKLKL